MYLKQLLPLSAFPDWDVVTDGPVRSVKLGDENPGHPLSSRITYYFKPDSARNVLVVYFAFLAENPTHASYVNPKFHIEVLKGMTGETLIPTPNPKDAYFLINPEGTGPANPDSHNAILENANKMRTCTASYLPVLWSDWFPVAFDLRPYDGQVIRLRITTQDL